MMKLNQEMESKNIPGLNIRKHVKAAQEREIMLQQFGRDPNRNNPLGRKSTQEELDYL